MALSARMLRLAGWSVFYPILMAAIGLSAFYSYPVSDYVVDMADRMREVHSHMSYRALIIALGTIAYVINVFQVLTMQSFFKERLSRVKHNYLFYAIVTIYIFTLFMAIPKYGSMQTSLQNPSLESFYIGQLIFGIWVLLAPGEMFKTKRWIGWLSIIWTLLVIAGLEQVGSYFGFTGNIFLALFFFRAAKYESQMPTSQASS